MKKRMFAAMIAMLLLLSQWCFAEQEYVDLNERFSEQITYEYAGETYYLKERVKTTLVLCANVPEDPQAGAGSVELLVILPVDDDSKLIRPIQFSPDMLVSWLEGEEQEKTFRQLFEETENAQAGCERMVEVLNALFPTAVVEQYAMLDMRGLPVLDGLENDGNNTAGEELIERLRAIKHEVEQGNKNVNTMINDLSGYIVTDMNSGAMMKVADKAERYSRYRRILFPVVGDEEETAESEDAATEETVTEETEIELPLIPDLETFEPMMLEIYYKDEGIWEKAE